MTLETIFLDAGGVLVFPNWHRISAALSARGVEVAPEALARAEPHAKRRLDEGRIIQTTRDHDRGWLYFNLILEQAGVTPDDRTRDALEEVHVYHRQSNLWEFMPAGVLPALRELKGLGLQLVIVSNANGTVRQLAERLGLTECVGCVLDSFVEKVEKPDPRFFEIALQRSGARRETTIHVGDLYEVDVVGARAAGIRPVLFDVAGLYPEADCPRVASLPALAEALRNGGLSLFGGPHWDIG